MGSGPSLHDMESDWNTATNPQLYYLSTKTPSLISLLHLCEVACFSKTIKHPYSNHLLYLKRVAGLKTNKQTKQKQNKTKPKKNQTNKLNSNKISDRKLSFG